MSMKTITDIGWNESGYLAALLFDLDQHCFAIPADMVREILDPLPETKVPGSNPLFDSIANFRGRIIPLVNLRRGFGLADTECSTDTRVVVIELTVEDHPCLIGLKVDKVHEVASIKQSSAELPPSVGLHFPRELIRCLIKRHGAIVAIPDLDHLFATNITTTAAPKPH